MFQLPAHLHPMVVHFPIALFITSLVFEIVSLVSTSQNLHKAAIYMYVTAALVTPLIVRTGMEEAAKIGLNHPILTQHRQYALWLMWTSLMSLPVLWFTDQWLKKYFKVLFIAFLIASAIFVSFTGDKGGRMVFEYGIGVE